MTSIYVISGFILLLSAALWVAWRNGKSAERLKQIEAELEAAETVAEKNDIIRDMSDEDIKKLKDKWTKSAD